LGYISNNKGYSDDYWYIFKNKLDNCNISDKEKMNLTLKSLKEFGDILAPGDSELFYIYEKFVKYCFSDKNNIVFYSCKNKKTNREDCVIELTENNKKFSYTLNWNTRLFEENIKQRGY